MPHTSLGGPVSLRVALLVFVVLLASACSGGFTEEKPGLGSRATKERTANDETIGSRPAREVVFIKQMEPTGPNPEFPTGIGGGTLAVDEAGCLRFEESGDLPVWPYEYSLVVRNGNSTLLNGKGQIEARIGDYVEVGGGQVTAKDGPPGESKQLFEDRRRELNIPDRCRGSLWYASPGVRVISGETTG